MKLPGNLLRLASRLRNLGEGQALLAIHRVTQGDVPSFDGEERERLLAEHQPAKAYVPPSLGTQVLAGCIIGLMIYAFCNVYASIVFEGPFGRQGVELGVSMNTAGAVLSGIATTLYSSCPIFIAAPEINMAMIHVSIAASIQQAVSSPDAALPSTVCAMVLSTLFLAAVFYLLGRFRLTRLVQFIPVVLVHGFLGCIGWEVLMTSMKQAARWEPSADTMHELGDWALWKRVIPAICMGVPLYLAKRYHWGNQSVVFPLFVVLPLVLFHFILWWAHLRVEDVREEWMFPEVSRSNFWQQWQIGWSVSNIELSVVLSNLPAFAVMGMIGTVDLLLKLAGSEKAIAGSEVDYDREFMLAGKGNLLCFACMAAPGYVQAKFNLINYALLHSHRERIPGLVSSLILAVLFFAGFPLLNIIPRFVLAGILIFVSAAFLTENLIDSGRTLAIKEFAAVWVIVVCSAFLGVLAAVGVGLVLASFIFAYQYAQRSAVRVQLTGADYRAVSRSAEDEAKLRQLGHLVLMLRLHGYIFFGSASQVREAVRQALRDVKYVLLDFTGVNGIDSAAVDVFVKVGRMAQFGGVTLLWSGLSPRVHYKLHREHVFGTDAAVFGGFPEAAEWIECRVLRFSRSVRRRWLVHPLLGYLSSWWALRRRAKQEWVPIVELEGYAERVTLDKGQTFCQAGDVVDALYYLLQGHFNVLHGSTEHPHVRRRQLSSGIFVLPESFVLNTPSDWTLVSAEECTLLCLPAEAIRALERNAPHTHALLLQLAMRQICREFHRLQIELDAVSEQPTRPGRAATDRFFEKRPGVGQKFVASVKSLARNMSGSRQGRSLSFSASGLSRSWAECQRDEPVQAELFLPELSQREIDDFTRIFVAATGSVRALLNSHDQTGLHQIAASLSAYQTRAESIDDPDIDTTDLLSFTWPVRQDVSFTLAEFLALTRRALYRGLSPQLVRRLQTVFQYASSSTNGVEAEATIPASPAPQGGSLGRSFSTRRPTGLSIETLREIMTSTGYPLDDAEVVKLIEQADRDATGAVDFDSFARLFSSGLQRERLNEEAQLAFNVFADPASLLTDCPVITHSSLLSGIESLGAVPDPRDVDEMLLDAGSSTHEVTFSDFVDAVLAYTTDFGW